MKLHYEVIGNESQDKSIFLHGVLGQGKNWRSFARHLSHNSQCLIYDQRGHGKSWHPSKGYNLEDLSQDLFELIKHVGWDSQPVNVIGHSMGGRVALVFANQFPELIKKLVIVDIGPRSDWASMDGILKMVNSVPVPFASRESAKEYLNTEFKKRHGAAMSQFFYTNIAKSPQGDWSWMFSVDGLKSILSESRLKDHWEGFKNLKMPTLLLRGEESTYLTNEDYIKILENNSNIQGHVIEKAGHWLHAEQPVETLKALKSFFNIDEPTT